jgi:hypothetical protein
MVDEHRRTFVLGAAGVLGASVSVSVAATAAPVGREVALLSTYVAGAGYHDAPGRAAGLKVGEELMLRRRPDCPYDGRTVEIWTGDGAMLGKVPRIDNQALANLMDSGFRPCARVRSVAADPKRPEIRLDISIAV